MKKILLLPFLLASLSGISQNSQFQVQEGTSICRNTLVHFINESTGADIWLWDFGDNETSTEFEPTHSYDVAGDYEVTLTAKHSETGNENTSSASITVRPQHDVIYSGPDAQTDYLVNNTFEEDELNSFPQGWIIRYEGTNRKDHYVVDEPVKNGDRAFRASGSGWAANLSKSVENIPDQVTLEGWIRAENVPSGGRCGLGIGNPDIGSWGAFWGRVEFYNGNLITFYYRGSSGSYGTQYTLQPAESNTWYHVKIVADKSAETYKVFINGDQASSNSGGSTITEFPLYSAVPATSVELYGNSMVYFDDIRLYATLNSRVNICASETPYAFGTQQLTESGTYTETFQNIHGCDSVVTLNLIVNSVDVSVQQENGLLTSNATGAFYQWLDCNNSMYPIDGETNQSFTPTVNGSYAVQVTQNGCTGVSDCFIMTPVGIMENNFENEIKVYPNPTNGRLFIHMGSSYPELVVTVCDFSGKQLQNMLFTNHQNLGIDINGPKGTYLITLASKKNKAVIKVVKN